MENNPLNDTDEMSETPSSTRHQRRRRKRKELKNEEYKMGDISSSDADHMCNKPSSAFGQRCRTKRKDSYGEKYKMEHNPFNDTDEENSSSISESTNTSDMWSVSSLEDIQFEVNTAAVEEVNVKTALQGSAASNEKDEQVDREGSELETKILSHLIRRSLLTTSLPQTRITFLQVSDQQTLMLRLLKFKCGREINYQASTTFRGSNCYGRVPGWRQLW